MFRETSRASRSSRAARSAASARSCVITLSRSATAWPRSASKLTSSAGDNGSCPATHKKISTSVLTMHAPPRPACRLSHQGQRGVGRRCRLVNSNRRKWRYTGDGSIADGSAP